MRINIKRKAMVLLSLMLLAGCGNAKQGQVDKKDDDASTVEVSESEDQDSLDIAVGNTDHGISCHDPQIMLADGKYYMTGSHQVIAVSDDLTSWKYIANGNKMFDNIFKGDLEAFKYVGKNEQGDYSIWASNFFYNETMKKYLMYFCTSSTYIKSSLCLAMADKPEGPYTFTEAFLHSGFTESEIDATNLREIIGEDADTSKYLEYGGYNNKLWPNCIDPAVFADAEGRQWMVYGSWSGGIFLLEIDKNTGLPIHPEDDEENGVDRYFGYHLCGGKHHAIEGPYISYNSENGYYYLFLSYGRLEREGGYQIREFRSKTPTGPYVDAAGNTLGNDDDFYTQGIKMAGNYKFPSLSKGYMAPGGQSTFQGADGNMYITYHQRFEGNTEYHEPRVHRLYLNSEDWYVMAPFETGDVYSENNELKASDIEGEYYFVDHKVDISSKLKEAEPVSLKDGSIDGLEDAGSYEFTEGSDDIKLTIGEVTYSGVVIDMKDEAGNDVRCISACGSDNHSIWMVRYLK